MKMAAWSFTVLCVYFLIILQAVTSTSGPQTQTYNFDENSGELSRSANISCPQDSVIEIISLEYYSRSVYCDQLVCPVVGTSGYLDGQHSVCQNEDRIRANCYAKQSCSIGPQGINITVPKEQCETRYAKAKLLRVKFSCIKSDYALDICEDRYETIPASQSVFLTTPSPDTAAGKASCSCDFKPANQQFFSQDITLIRQRMAHFFNDEYFLYRPAGHSGSVDTDDDSPFYLLMTSTHEFGVNLNQFTVVFADNTKLSAQSRVYVKLTSNDRMEMWCNNAINSQGMYTKVYTNLPTRRASSIPPASSTNTVPATQATSRKAEMTRRPKMTPDVVTSSTTGKGGSGGGLTQRDMIITALAVALCVIIIVVMLLICLFCFRRKRKQKKKQMEQMKISNNNSERLPGDGVEYHELEQPETYDVIPDNNVYSDPYEKAEDYYEAAPYTVTVLDRDGHPTPHHDREMSQSTQLKNGRVQPIRNSITGSVDALTEESSPAGDYYAQPCTVKGTSHTAPNPKSNEGEYDAPPPLPPLYGTVSKAKSEVELLDNPLYEASP